MEALGKQEQNSSKVGSCSGPEPSRGAPAGRKWEKRSLALLSWETWPSTWLRCASTISAPRQSTESGEGPCLHTGRAPPFLV